MQNSAGLIVGAFVFSASLAMMGVIHYGVKENRCPTDCRLVSQYSGTGCGHRQCYCPDAPETCQPRKPTLTTHQRRAMRLLYGFVIIGLSIIIFFSACLCCRADGPTSHINPPELFPSLDSRSNFPERGYKAYDYIPVTELTVRR